MKYGPTKNELGKMKQEIEEWDKSHMTIEECPDCKIKLTPDALKRHIMSSMGDHKHPKALKNFMKWGSD